MARLDEVSATPPRYPYSMHRQYSPSRNPRLPLLPRPAKD
jgi:hypothetical protein